MAMARRAVLCLCSVAGLERPEAGPDLEGRAGQLTGRLQDCCQLASHTATRQLNDEIDMAAAMRKADPARRAVTSNTYMYTCTRSRPADSALARPALSSPAQPAQEQGDSPTEKLKTTPQVYMTHVQVEERGAGGNCKGENNRLRKQRKAD